jgi:group I intron endonuclease
MCGFVYKITNKLDGKVYIGQTWNTITCRFSQHCRDARGHYLHRAIRKYGQDSFSIVALVVFHTQKVADYWEQYFISHYNSCDHTKGYNLRDGGSRGSFSIELNRYVLTVRKLRQAIDNVTLPAPNVARKPR